mmetsp:Transcript_13169/g.32133  ORF Transcript_13169/g.32133 Transcript_13169/m.32133 type:complete len:538 (-) Transcript_13169:110-1723(-)
MTTTTAATIMTAGRSDNDNNVTRVDHTTRTTTTRRRRRRRKRSGSRRKSSTTRLAAGSINSCRSTALLLVLFVLVTMMVLDLSSTTDEGQHTNMRMMMTVKSVSAFSLPSLLLSSPEVTSTAVDFLKTTVMNNHHHVDAASTTVAFPDVMEQLQNFHQHSHLFGIGPDVQATTSAATTSTTTLISSSSASISDPATTSSLPSLSTSLMEQYRAALKTDPLKTKMITGSISAVVADAIAQSATMSTPAAAATTTTENNSKNNVDDGSIVREEKEKSFMTRFSEQYNPKRAVAFAVFDACWRAVQQLSYSPLYKICDGHLTVGLLSSIPFVDPSSATMTAQQNVHLMAAWEQTLVSQLVLIPALYYPVFYITTSFVQNLTVEQTIERAKETFIPLMKRNLQFWIPVQFAVFGFVDEELQIPILIVAGLVWTIILSILAGNVSTSSETSDTVSATDVGGEAVVSAVVADSAVTLLDDYGVEETMIQAEPVALMTTSSNSTTTDIEFDLDSDNVDVAVDVSEIRETSSKTLEMNATTSTRT